MSGFGLSFGALCGLLVGIYVDQMTWGLIVGAGIGLIFSLYYDRKKEKQ